MRIEAMVNKLPTTGLFLSLFTLGLGGCEGRSLLEVAASLTDPQQSDKVALGGGGEGGEAVTHEQPCPDPDRELPPTAEMCPPGRQVGAFAGDCPAAAGWSHSKLSAPLDNYCRYIWGGAGAPQLGALPADVGPDCRVLAQSPLREALAGDYEAAFVEGTQPLPGKQMLSGGHPVDIAVVDTAPAATSKGAAPHGPTMAAIVARLASGCAPGLDKSAGCAREVATYLGLPQTAARGADHVAGGDFGYQSDLAEGIAAALAGWANKDHRLIINLAVGWEPQLGDLDGSGTETGGLATVRDALGLAHCQGALVVAASGNQPKGSCVEQPTVPGSWEAQRAWTQAQCKGLGLADAQLRLSTHDYSPFVFAATPLSWGAQNLADFRPGSNARLATLGFSGYDTRAGGQSGRHYGPMTGSSVSTAVVSGIAALVWSYFPTLEAAELMQLIYDSGARRQQGTTKVIASHHLPGPSGSPHQHVVTACGALVHACDDAGVDAPAQCADARSRCADLSSSRVDEQAWWDGFEDALSKLPGSERIDVSGPTWTAYECSSCNESAIAELPRQQQISPEHMPDPWILPQPERAPCPICSIKGSKVYLSLDPVYDNAVNASNNVNTSRDYFTLDNVSLYLYDALGASEVLHYGAVVRQLDSINVQVIDDAELQTVGARGQGQPPATAYVLMQFTNGAGDRIQASNEIPVEP